MTETYGYKHLLLAVTDKDCEKLLETAALSRSKKSDFSFKNVMEKMPIDEMDRMWIELSELVVEKTECILLSNTRKPDKKMCADVSLLIQMAIDLALVVFEQSMPASKGLLHMVVFLNRVIFEIPISMEHVKNNIALMCERMYHLNYLYQDHELITYNTIIYLLKRSLLPKAAKRDVKRIYALRSLIPKVVNMKEMDTSEVWDLLKQCAVSSIYLSMTEGQKVLGLILTLDVDHIAEIHNAIKKRLLSCTLGQGTAYGKVYFEAWSSAVKINSEELRNELEMMCLQDFVMTVVRSRQKSVIAILRKVLGQFHCQKKEVYVAKMLYNLYQPIVWRYVKNSDGLMRANTGQIFLDVFPLEDPDVKLVTTDMELNEQLLMIKDLLVDDFPLVRSTSIIGLCIAMSVNWELFPEDMLKTYFRIIVNELSCDSSSSEVRLSVAKGLKVLLENPLTVPTMHNILPKVRFLFHDVSENVRIAFCQLLLRVKKISGIKYYDIVPLDHLFARMEEDKAVGKILVNLLHNSFFPKGVDIQVWMSRCVEVHERYAEAARVFFQFVPNFIGLQATAEFMIHAVRSIHNFVKSKVTGQKSKSVTKEKENRLNSPVVDVVAVDGTLSFHNNNTVSAILDSISIMWLASLTQLEQPENKSILKMIVARLARCLGDLVMYYKDTPVWRSVYYLSSFMPSHTIPSLASLCFVRLKAMEPESCVPEQYITLLECLCNHNEASSVLILLKEWIQDGFKDEMVLAPPSKKRRTKGCADLFRQPILGIEMLNSMLDHRSCQKVVLAKHPEGLLDLIPLAEDIKKKVEECQDRRINEKEARFLTELLYALEKISVLLHAEEKFDSVPFIEGLVVWVQEKLLKNIFPDNSLNSSSSRRSSRRSSLQKKKSAAAIEGITLAICKDLCVVIEDMTLVGYMDRKSLLFVKFVTKLLSCGSGPNFMVHVSILMWRHTSFGVYLGLQKEGDVLSILSDCFSKIIQCLNDEAFFERIPAIDLKDIQHSLSSAVLLMYYHSAMTKETISEIVSLFSKTILIDIIKDPDSWEDIEQECKPFDKIQISKSGAFFLQIMCFKPKLELYFLQQIRKYITKPGSNLQSWVAAYVVVLSLGNMKNSSKMVCKEIHHLVDEMKSALRHHLPMEVMQLDDSEKENEEDLNILDKENAQEISHGMSFREHCIHEYKKLKDVIKAKVIVT